MHTNVYRLLLLAAQEQEGAPLEHHDTLPRLSRTSIDEFLLAFAIDTLQMTSIPAIAMRPTVKAAESGDITIATSKEWVLPPKPKPGRKPSVDNAPTKRKTQNRDAQRAFRERRAARVGELEQQIKEIESEHRQTLETIESEKSLLRMENHRLRERVEAMNKELSTIRSLTHLSRSPGHTFEAQRSIQPPAFNPSHVQQTASPAPSMDDQKLASPPHLRHISEINLGLSVPLKRKSKRLSEDAEQRDFFTKKWKGPSTVQDDSERGLHPDFTFSSEACFKPPESESCGFCSDGTPCFCAEAAREYTQSEYRSDSETLGDISRLDASGPAMCAVCTQELPCLCSTVQKFSKKEAKPPSLPTIIEEENGLCTGNPGSCRQCQLDPMSTLFCQSLASAAPMITNVRPPLLHKASSTFSISSARETTPPVPPSASASYVPCSAAYQSLSRHSNFGATDLGTLVAGLRVDTQNGRGVEIGSVRDVLRILDRGLGRDN